MNRLRAFVCALQIPRVDAHFVCRNTKHHAPRESRRRRIECRRRRVRHQRAHDHLWVRYCQQRGGPVIRTGTLRCCRAMHAIHNVVVCATVGAPLRVCNHTAPPRYVTTGATLWVVGVRAHINTCFNAIMHSCVCDVVAYVCVCVCKCVSTPS